MDIGDETITNFLDRHQLPDLFVQIAIDFYVPFGQWVERQIVAREGGNPMVIGINGAQGTGKSTLADSYACTWNMRMIAARWSCRLTICI
jgi:D-glycerate 3-kinase